MCAALIWIENTFGSIDLLINNAGVMTTHLLLDNDNTKDLLKLIETSLLGCVIVTKKVIAKMVENNVMGHVINVSPNNFYLKPRRILINSVQFR